MTPAPPPFLSFSLSSICVVYATRPPGTFRRLPHRASLCDLLTGQVARWATSADAPRGAVHKKLITSRISIFIIMFMTSPEPPSKNSSPAKGGQSAPPSPRAECSAVSRKIAILGGRGVGKSAITHYCIHGEKRIGKEPHPSVEYAHHMRFTVTKYPKASFNCCLVDTPGVVGAVRQHQLYTHN